MTLGQRELYTCFLCSEESVQMLYGKGNSHNDNTIQLDSSKWPNFLTIEIHELTHTPEIKFFTINFLHTCAAVGNDSSS